MANNSVFLSDISPLSQRHRVMLGLYVLLIAILFKQIFSWCAQSSSAICNTLFWTEENFR